MKRMWVAGLALALGAGLALGGSGTRQESGTAPNG